MTRAKQDPPGGLLARRDDATLRPFAEQAERWVLKRRQTHRDARHDIGRMRRHLIPFFGALSSQEISDNPWLLRQYIELKRQELGGATIQRTLALLSRFFNELKEDGAFELKNPVALLGRATRRLMRSTVDQKATPFLRRKEDIARLYHALPPADVASPYRVMFAVGVLSGLRPGEILALHWQRDVDLKRRRIHVQCQVSESVLGPVKDDESRVAPILDALLPVLYSWQETSGGVGLCFAPIPRRGGRKGSPPRFRRLHTLHKHLRRAQRAAHLPETLTWYQCTRHTFASHWVMDGGSLAKLKEILGHCSVKVTERYAHLRPDMYGPEDYAKIALVLE